MPAIMSIVNTMVAAFYNASSASPEFVSGGLNPDGTLAKKTHGVVIWGPPFGENMAVYRESSTAPGYLSADLYRWRSGGWEFLAEDVNKHTAWPAPPPGAIRSHVAGVGMATRHALTEAERVRIVELGRTPRRRGARSA